MTAPITTHHKPMTTAQVKAAYKKNGQQVSEEERRRLARGAEVEERIARVRAREAAKKEANRKRREKERKEREAREQMGIGLATQMVGYSHSQAAMKNRMEAFVGKNKNKRKRDPEEEERERQAKAQKLFEEEMESAADEEVAKDPWDIPDDEIDLDALQEPVSAISHAAPQTNQGTGTKAKEPDPWSDDELDDESLLQAEDLAKKALFAPRPNSGQSPAAPAARPFPRAPGMMAPPPKPSVATGPTAMLPPSKPLAKQMPNLTRPSGPSAAAPAAGIPTKPSTLERPSTPEPMAPASERPMFSPPRDEDPEFTRIHGPVDTAIEKLLDAIDEPLHEFFSRDTSSTPGWNPQPTLLHRLHPPHIPPHRLRLRKGCLVKVLQDVLVDGVPLPTGAKLEFQDLNAVKGTRLECKVLEGRYKGSVVLLTRKEFGSVHRGDVKKRYRRTQFPVKVLDENEKNEFINNGPGIKKDGRGIPNPLSKLIQTIEAKKAAPPPLLPVKRAPPTLTRVPSIVESEFDDDVLGCFASGTQIERELSEELDAKPRIPTPQVNASIPSVSGSFFSDMAELPQSTIQPRATGHTSTPPHRRMFLQASLNTQKSAGKTPERNRPWLKECGYSTQELEDIIDDDEDDFV